MRGEIEVTDTDAMDRRHAQRLVKTPFLCGGQRLRLSGYVAG
jgi:hypothetical protein